MFKQCATREAFPILHNAISKENISTWFVRRCLADKLPLQYAVNAVEAYFECGELPHISNNWVQAHPDLYKSILSNTAEMHKKNAWSDLDWAKAYPEHFKDLVLHNIECPERSFSVLDVPIQWRQSCPQSYAEVVNKLGVVWSAVSQE